jgi:putative transposase
MAPTPISVELIQNSTFWKPKCPNTAKPIPSKSWFDIKGARKQILENEEDKYILKNRQVSGTILRCKKIIIKPTQKQRNLLKIWLNIYRQVYNITVRYFRKNKCYGKKKARLIIKNRIKKKPYLQKLIKNTGFYSHSIDNAIFDVIKAYKSGFSNLKAGNIKYFRLRCKKMKKPTQIMVLETANFNKEGTGLTFKKLYNLNPSTPIKTKCDVRLQYNKRTKQFTLFVPEYKDVTIKAKRLERCALDPGMRTFQTAYSDNNVYFQFGTQETNNEIKKIIRRIEAVNDKKQEKWYNKFTNRLRTKLRNKITDMHWKIARFLCKRFDNIMIGNMSTNAIIKKHRSVLTPEGKRFIKTLSHYTFRRRLEIKCEEFAVNFRCVDESYTSKTCGSCGNINNRLGGNEIFTCPLENCDYVMDRDIHGARNILIKNIV